ncbi:MAG: ATP-binding cassette domain-containing protein [Chromatiales bacterium]|jgi:ABC-2 type transport system ATP-binding protein
MDTLVEVENLTRRFGARIAVDRLGLSVRAGDVLGLLGPNGAGKSTTMRMLSGCLAPTSGQIRIDGIDLLRRPRAAKARIGYLPERPPLYRELTVDEYLSYAARLRGTPAHEVPDRLRRVRQRCGLGAAGRRLVGNLSKGYQQRVGIAQALVHAPAVVILDEPTAGLDPIQIREVRELIADIGRECAVLLSTHILPEVQAVCTRAVIIHHGRLVYSEALQPGDGAGPAAVVIALERPPDLTEIQALAGVRRAERLRDGRFRLELEPEAGRGAAVAEQITACGWGLIELAPQRPGIEQTFVELTAGEAA